MRRRLQVAIVVVGIAFVLVAANAAEARALSCKMVIDALRSGKSRTQVVSELHVSPKRLEHCSPIHNRWYVPAAWSTCAAINRAIDDGAAKSKTPLEVAAELKIDPNRASDCQACFAKGYRNRVLSKTDGDVDGDGKPDEIKVELEDCDPTLVADLSRLGRRAIAIEVSPRYLAALGVCDIDGDRRGEVFVQTDRGATAAVFTIFR